MPLFLAQWGVPFAIIRISGNEKVRHHMESLGFLPGTAVMVVSTFNDYFIVSVRGSRIGISADMAKRIIVRQEAL